MGFRNNTIQKSVKKTKSGEKAKKVSSKSKVGKTRPKSRGKSRRSYDDSVDERSMGSPVVVISDMVASMDRDFVPDYEEDSHVHEDLDHIDEDARGAEKGRRDSDESVSTLNSLYPSPVRASIPSGNSVINEGATCHMIEEEHSSFHVDEDESMLDNEQQTEQPTASAPPPHQSIGLFSRIFSIFGRRSLPVLPATTQIQRMPEVAIAPEQPAILEVIHIFPDPSSALAHEGLMNRQKARLSRASISGAGHSANVDRTTLAVKDMPSSESVVLLRQVLSPRPENHPSQTEVLDKASERPDLWVFMTFSSCKLNYAAELCDYLNNRCSWPSSKLSSPVQMSTQPSAMDDGETTPQQEATASCPTETPMMDYPVNDLPPNTIDAPWKGVRSSDVKSQDTNERSYPRVTPVSLEYVEEHQKKGDFIDVEEIDLDENSKPIECE